MSKAKTQIDKGQVQSFLGERLSPIEPSLEPIADGEISQAFFFNSAEGERVLRINSWEKVGFLKDAYAADHFSSIPVPVPKILEVGEVSEGIFFAISERALGKTLDKFSKEETEEMIPLIIKVLDTIHATPPAGEGYGPWDIDGKGKKTSWHEFLVSAQGQPDDYLMEAVDFFEPALHQALNTEIHTFIPYCPEERRLVHADFGFNNVISDGTRITGVIDWEQSMYGDPLYDIAWLEFWGAEHGYEEIFRKHYSSQGRLPVNYHERVTCYKLNIGHGALCFFAKSEQPEKYNTAKQILSRVKR